MNEIQKHRALSLPFIHREEKEEEISGVYIILAIRAACNSQSTPRLTCKSELGIVEKSTVHNSDCLCLQSLVEGLHCLECCEMIGPGLPVTSSCEIRVRGVVKKGAKVIRTDR